MRKALSMAGLENSDIQWVHCHGTGTADNDRSETIAIGKVFADKIPTISSTKGFTGHTTSASGGISAVISLIAMKEGFIPASLGFQKADEGAIAPTQGVERAELHNIMVNSFGFGGNDTSLILSDKASETNSQTESDSEIVEVGHVENVSVEALPAIKQYVRPMEARRMGKLMKSTLLTSLQALKEAEIDMPDAIVTGTYWGSLEYSEKLMRQIIDGDDVFKPTFFMQSTHNTIGSMIAIHLKCHGYNITFTQGAKSLDWALYQAKLLLKSGQCRTVLVGCHDESTPGLNEILEAGGKKSMPPVKSVAIVLKRKD
jgi:3-oxoacyl-(acyl-carrier-protein) synthase